MILAARVWWSHLHKLEAGLCWCSPYRPSVVFVGYSCAWVFTGLVFRCSNVQQNNNAQQRWLMKRRKECQYTYEMILQMKLQTPWSTRQNTRTSKQILDGVHTGIGLNCHHGEGRGGPGSPIFHFHWHPWVVLNRIPASMASRATTAAFYASRLMRSCRWEWNVPLSSSKKGTIRMDDGSKQRISPYLPKQISKMKFDM